MTNTYADRHGQRALRHRRLHTETHRTAREYRRRLVLQELTCPRCGVRCEMMEEPFMCGGTLADGSQLPYWRCPDCRMLFSMLTRPAAQGRAGAGEGADALEASGATTASQASLR